MSIVGAPDAGFGLLLDTISSVQTFVTVFIWVYTLLIFAYVITSWIQMPYSLSGVQRFLRDVCEPYLRLFRRILPPLGPLDLSPIVAVGVLILLQYIVNSVILNRL
ncbi:MAG: cell division protein ZapA [Candidatus Rokuibacteriota bacterium]|nr:MAG: cell division protein ZapA [Candidatus Rokubacteria bacterium]